MNYDLTLILVPRSGQGMSIATVKVPYSYQGEDLRMRISLPVGLDDDPRSPAAVSDALGMVDMLCVRRGATVDLTEAAGRIHAALDAAALRALEPAGPSPVPTIGDDQIS